MKNSIFANRIALLNNVNSGGKPINPSPKKAFHKINNLKHVDSEPAIRARKGSLRTPNLSIKSPIRQRKFSLRDSMKLKMKLQSLAQSPLKSKFGSPSRK
jgi:hypothetical protein